MAALARFFSRLFWLGLAVGALALTAGTVSPLLAGRVWYCELATHFQLQYVELLAAATALFALSGRLKSAVFTLVVTASAFCYHLLPLYVGGHEQTSETRTLRLISSNVAFFNQTQDELVDFLAAEKPDVVLLFEVSPDWLSTLKILEPEYPHFKVEPRERHSGIAIFSRLPLESVQLRTVGANPSPVVTATVKANDRTLTVIGAHPDPPVSWKQTRDRNDQLAGLAELVVALPTPLVVAGDLNTSSWNPAFQRLLRDTGLRDSRQGRGVQMTWPASVPGMQTAIDHCLVSPRVKVLDRWVGRDIGSDHLPIVVDLLVK